MYAWQELPLLGRDVCYPVCLCFAVLDNLVKGAAGQAMQNLNIMMGQPEETALMQQAMFP